MGRTCTHHLFVRVQDRKTAPESRIDTDGLEFFMLDHLVHERFDEDVGRLENIFDEWPPVFAMPGQQAACLRRKWSQ